MSDIDTISERHRPVALGLDPDVCDICIEQISPGLRFRQVPWPCDTRVVLDALDEWKGNAEWAAKHATTAQDQREAARADADRLADALRELARPHELCWCTDEWRYRNASHHQRCYDAIEALRLHDT